MNTSLFAGEFYPKVARWEVREDINSNTPHLKGSVDFQNLRLKLKHVDVKTKSHQDFQKIDIKIFRNHKV